MLHYLFILTRKEHIFSEEGKMEGSNMFFLKKVKWKEAVAVPRPGDPGHSPGLRANFFAISCVNFYEFFI